MSSTPDVTQLLLKWGNGDRDALENLLPLVYRELHQLASRYLRRERRGACLHLREKWRIVEKGRTRCVCSIFEPPAGGRV